MRPLERAACGLTLTGVSGAFGLVLERMADGRLSPRTGERLLGSLVLLAHHADSGWNARTGQRRRQEFRRLGLALDADTGDGATVVALGDLLSGLGAGCAT